MVSRCIAWGYAILQVLQSALSITQLVLECCQDWEVLERERGGGRERREKGGKGREGKGKKTFPNMYTTYIL